MIDKGKYLDTVRNMAAIYGKYDFLKESLPEIANIEADIDDFAFRVVLIGGFSSGKSALLNRLVGKELFKENQGPETSIPAEVSWAPAESAQAVWANGAVKNVELDKVTANPPTDAQYLAMRLDIPFLKERRELILVDFPGFDSNVEAHNKAINAYLRKGSAFLLLVPAQNGTLMASDLKFLKEAAYYPQSLACFISKADVRPPEKCAEIVEFVREGIRTAYGADVPVTPISTRDGSDEEFQGKLASMVDRFNPQELFNISLAPVINEQLNKGIGAMQEYMQASSLDVRDIEKRMAESRDMEKQLARDLERERRNLDNKYQYEVVPGIMDRLEGALKRSVSTLTEAALDGEQRFADAVQGVVRPILASLPGEMQTNLRDLVSGMRFTQPRGQQGENQGGNDEAMRNTLLNIVDVISTVIPTGKGGQAGGGRQGKPGMPAQRPGDLLSGVGTGLLVGVAGSPILGLLIGLAPALINIFFGGGNQSQQPDPRAQMRAQVESSYIPAILGKLQDQILPAVRQTQEIMFTELKQRFDESVAANRLALEQAGQEKEKKEAEYKQNLEQMQKDLDALMAMIIA